MTGRLAVTIDVEDWYHIPSVTGSPFSTYKNADEFYENWDERYDYLSKPTSRVLDILDEYDVEATFFVVAGIVEHYPGLVESISDRGHEIGCHGLDHSCIIDPGTKKPLVDVEDFRENTLKAKITLERSSGQQVTGYRAPNALVGKWMLEELPGMGFVYDSSISVNSFYKRNDLELDGVSTKPYHVLPGLVEFPMAYWEILGVKFPSSGGPVLRLLGEGVVRRGLEQSLRRGDTVLYFHPIDISQEKFHSIGNKRPFYWIIKGSVVERRIRNLIEYFHNKNVELSPLRKLEKTV